MDLVAAQRRIAQLEKANRLLRRKLLAQSRLGQRRCSQMLSHLTPKHRAAVKT